jgi:hypothetical protein
LNAYEIAAEFLEKVEGQKVIVSHSRMEQDSEKIPALECWRCHERILDDYITIANAARHEIITAYFHIHCFHVDMKQKATADTRYSIDDPRANDTS